MAFSKPSYNDLYEHYIILGEPMHIIADKLGCAVGTIYNYIKKYDIPTRTQKECMNLLKSKGWEYPKESILIRQEKMKDYKMSDETKQKLSDSHFKGGVGHKKKRVDGYISIYFPEHPKSNKDGYIMEHDLVMECYIGRHLLDDEVVHHINKNKSDNRLSNLQLMTFKEHARLHLLERQEEKRRRKNNE